MCISIVSGDESDDQFVTQSSTETVYKMDNNESVEIPMVAVTGEWHIFIDFLG